jgi:hypothetical protein
MSRLDFRDTEDLCALLSTIQLIAKQAGFSIASPRGAVFATIEDDLEVEFVP